MPRKMYVFTFGWSPEFVIRPLLREGVERDDYVLLLTNKPESEYARRKLEEAYQQVVSFLSYAGLAGRVTYREVEVEGKEFTEICLDIARILAEELSERRPSATRVYLSGGMRVLILAALVVVRLLRLRGENVEVFTSMETRPVFYSVPVEALTVDVTRVTEEQLELLRALSTLGEVPVEDLAMGRARDTARKLLAKLMDKGLVTYRVRGRRHFYSLTPLGKLVVLCSGR